MGRIIRFKDEACYDIDEIIKSHECSEEEAIEIAEEWFSEREPFKLIIPDYDAQLAQKWDSTGELNKESDTLLVSNMINIMRDTCKLYGINSVKIHKDGSCVIKF